MVKKFLKFIAFTLFFIASLICFMPKSSLYYMLEHKLQPIGVSISSQSAKDGCFTLKLKESSLFVKSIQSAHIAKTEIKFFVLYNSIDMTDIKLSSAAASFLPLHVQSTKVKYSILDPLNIRAKIVGEFGEADAKADLIKRVVHVVLKPSKIMLKEYVQTLRNLKKSVNGEFIYEQNF